MPRVRARTPFAACACVHACASRRVRKGAASVDLMVGGGESAPGRVRWSLLAWDVIEARSLARAAVAAAGRGEGCLYILLCPPASLYRSRSLSLRNARPGLQVDGPLLACAPGADFWWLACCMPAHGQEAFDAQQRTLSMGMAGGRCPERSPIGGPAWQGASASAVARMKQRAYRRPALLHMCVRLCVCVCLCVCAVLANVCRQPLRLRDHIAAARARCCRKRASGKGVRRRLLPPIIQARRLCGRGAPCGRVLLLLGCVGCVRVCVRAARVWRGFVFLCSQASLALAVFCALQPPASRWLDDVF